MADIIPNANVSNTESTTSTTQVQPSSQNAATAEASATANANKKDFDMNTKVSSAADLKEKAPEVWDKMMEGIAQNIISDMRKRQERLKKMMRESRQR